MSVLFIHVDFQAWVKRLPVCVDTGRRQGGCRLLVFTSRGPLGCVTRGPVTVCVLGRSRRYHSVFFLECGDLLLLTPTVGLSASPFGHTWLSPADHLLGPLAVLLARIPLGLGMVVHSPRSQAFTVYVLAFLNARSLLDHFPT